MELSGIQPSSTGSFARLPPPLRPGDKVGVAALSGSVDPARLRRGLFVLRHLGFRPVEASNLRQRHGVFAGEDAARLDGFHRLAADPEIRGIIFARGGHGVLRILPGIDWSLLGRHPRPYVGYSDLTPFLLQVVERLGLVAFHGPMVAADLARGLLPEERDSLLAALAGRFPLSYSLPGCSQECAVKGAAEVGGTLLGGCLSMLEATLGTPYAPSLAGALLFVEDIAEPYYRLDRMLTHLRLSDSLTDIKGIVFGHLIGGRGEAQGRSARRGLQRWRAGFLGRRKGARGASKQVVDHSLPKRLMEVSGLPYAWGLNAGHGWPNLTLPLGLEAQIQPGPEGSRLCIGSTINSATS